MLTKITLLVFVTLFIISSKGKKPTFKPYVGNHTYPKYKYPQLYRHKVYTALSNQGKEIFFATNIHPSCSAKKGDCIPRAQCKKPDMLYISRICYRRDLVCCYDSTIRYPSIADPSYTTSSTAAPVLRVGAETEGVMPVETDAVIRAESKVVMRPESEARMRNETEAVMRAESEDVLRPESEALMRPESKAMMRAETEAVMHAETEAVMHAETEAVMHAEIEAVMHAETEAVMHAETEAVMHAETEAVMHAETEAVMHAETEAVMHAETEGTTTSTTVLFW